MENINDRRNNGKQRKQRRHKGLRDKLKSEQENKEQNVVKTSLFKDVGLDPNSGTGKMAFDLYDGKPDTAELGQWLKETYNIDAEYSRTTK